MKLYLKYFQIHLHSQMQYKVSFFLTVIGQFILSFSAFLEIYFMMTRFHTVNDFPFEEVLLCFAIVMLAFALAECFVRGFDGFSSILGNGQFDRILVRPRNIIFQVLATKIELSRIGRFIQAAIIFAYAIPRCQIIWSADKIFTLILMVISGVVVFSGLFIIYASLCFFTTEGLEFLNIFTDGGREFGKYPFSIYGEGVLKLFTYIIPLALFQYYPFLYLIGKTEDIKYMLAPLIAFLFLIPCFMLWHFGLKHYKSTGS
ncbi:ABC transporter permease [Beduini massiliensis]|uniref:ABC transporter permease n=1 Tax=Beduini massiliensis TaxID=1585974 RepID=UPI00059A79DA|nr:ABC-2 family transporter protein [Beduini massiliensis]